MGGPDKSTYRVAPLHYLHVLDVNSNITRVVLGPVTFHRQDNESVVLGPESYVSVPDRHYCKILNPVVRDEDGDVAVDASGMVRLRYAEQEIRLAQAPFPLYPGEVLETDVTPLTVLEANSALHLKAVLDFTDEEGKKHVAGEEWLFRGPATYVPRVEVQQLELRRATIILPNTALRLRATTDLVDSRGKKRCAGEEWLEDHPGAYLPGVYEEVASSVSAHVLTEQTALHLRATRSFTDRYGKDRVCGEEWLVTLKDAETHLVDVFEELEGVQQLTTLTNRQFAVVSNLLGEKRLVKGPSSFFLQPGEELETGVEDVIVLGEDEGLVLRAKEAFTEEAFDDAGKPQEAKRAPGSRWMIRGPRDYVPPTQVEIVQRRRAIPLDDNEGIYVRNIKTGKVRSVVAQTYMLDEHEELYEKQLPPLVEELLLSNRDPMADRSERDASASGGRGGSRRGAGGGGSASGARDKTRVVTYRVPHNAAMQVYDYAKKQTRIVFGPDLVLLGPDEQITPLSLSGGKPKRPNTIKALCLLLGPDFCTDVITIETADHARLQLQLSYNWRFDIKDRSDPEQAAKCFSVPDFIGDLCKAIASRVRGAVASVSFDDFHRASAKTVRASVFGLDENGKVRDSLSFPANGLTVTSIDIQSAEPVDQRTRDALQKSVQLAIEITTNSQEAAARHEAERLEQAAKGALERQKIEDEANAEGARKRLLELQAASAAVESSGQAKAEAQSRAEATAIEAQAAVQQAKLKAEAEAIAAEAELDRLEKAREAELDFIRKRDELELAKSERMASLRINEFQNQMKALGPENLVAMAAAPQMAQANLLKGLGISSTVISSGENPINLMNVARGFLGAAATGDQ